MGKTKQITQAIAHHPWTGWGLHFLGLTLVFGIPYTQDPLYTDNQNTKFLQGLAQAGLGNLQDDWLANTLDPLPAFTFLVRWSYTLFGEYSFYVWALLGFGIYIYSLMGIAAHIFQINRPMLKYWVYLVILIGFHTIAIEIKLLGFRTARHFHYGLADQYILGHYFQPSMFGVLILLSIYLFLQRQPFRAVLLLPVVASFHPAYLPSAAILTLAYMITLYQGTQKWQSVLGIGAIAGFGCLPVFLYMTWTFQPTTAELWQQSQEIIVHFRIPHHSLPQIWLATPAAVIQIAIMAYGLYLIRKTRLVWIMGLPMAIATVLVGVQLLSGSDTLAFTAPWRVSAFLMPLALAIVLGNGVNQFFIRFAPTIERHQSNLQKIAWSALAVLVLGGVIHQVAIAITPDPTLAMMKFVRDDHQPGDVYAVPIETEEQIWLEDRLWKFRLFTGTPQLINIKSHPYKDVEVIEWFERVQALSTFYHNRPARRCPALRAIQQQYAITHVVLDNGRRDLDCDFTEKIHEDDDYEVYRVLRSP